MTRKISFSMLIHKGRNDSLISRITGEFLRRGKRHLTILARKREFCEQL